MKKIEFSPTTLESENMVFKPVPAYETIPDWYKKSKKYVGEKKEINEKTGTLKNLGMKACIPFLDSFTMGYVQKTWNDIEIKEKNGEVFFSESGSPKTMWYRENNNQLPKDDYYYPIEFMWKMYWIPKLPKGYSIMYTHPPNRFDLPFYSLTGIVDADSLNYENEANHPFLLKKYFTGKIPAGTPIVSIIPFKRESWRSFFNIYNEDDKILQTIPRKMFEGYYKKFMWSKKEFK